MLRTCRLVLPVALALAAWPRPASAQDTDLRALVLKAQEAHGGKAAIAKYQGIQVKYKGEVDANGMKAAVEGEVAYLYPDRMKNVIDVDVNGMKIQVQQGYDGKALWVSVAGMTQEITDKDLIAEMKESMYCERVAGLDDIDSKDYKLSALGEMKIKGKDAVGVRVSKTGRRDVNLWFDKKSHLLLKSEWRGKDPFGMQGEASQEKFFDDYKAVMGVQMPQKMEVHVDGKKLVGMELSDVRLSERLDPSLFTKP